MATHCALAQPLCQGICECKQARLQAAPRGRGLLGNGRRLPSQVVSGCLLLQPPLPVPVPLPCVKRLDFSTPRLQYVSPRCGAEAHCREELSPATNTARARHAIARATNVLHSMTAS